MGQKNAYLARKEAEKTAFMHDIESIVHQYDADTLMITLHEEFGWGYDRLMDLSKKWKQRQVEYREAVNPDKKNESDIQQARIDRMLVQIIRGKQKLIPFDERYPALRKIKY